ncbi:MAG: AsmA family protein [Candidatus Binatia bacterium]
MRKLALGVLTVAVLAAALLAAAALSLNRIIARNHNQILERAQAALGRPVTVGTITVSLWGGLGIQLNNLRIADDPRFSAAEFVSAAALAARARLWPLLHGVLEIGRIDLTRPEIHLIRDTSGQWNYATLKPTQPDAQPPAAMTAPAIVRVAAVTMTAPEALPLLVSQATIDDGTLVIDDRSQNPARTTRVTHIDLALRDISQTTPIRFNLDAALQAEARNIHTTGTVGPLADRSAIPFQLDGALGPLGPQAVRIDELHVKTTITPDSVRASQINGRAFDGSFKLTGQYPLRPSGEFALDGQLKDIALAKVLEITMQDAAKRIEGAGQLAVNLRGTGSGSEAIQRSLTGTVVADVHRGVIKDFNLVDQVLGHITGLPGIDRLISSNVKPKYAKLFAAPDTQFDTLHGSFRIADQRIQTDDLAVVATDYGVGATGWIGFDRQLDVAGRLLMSKAFSTDVVADVKEAKYFLDADGQLAVPFRLRGKIGEAKPQADSDYLIDALTRAVTHGGANDLLEKLFGGKQHSPKATPGGEPPGKTLEQSLRDLLGR